MSTQSKASEKPIRASQRSLAMAGVALAVFLVTLAGAWAEARWPRGVGTYIKAQAHGTAEARDILWQLQRVDGVRNAVAVFQGSLATADIEGTGWREVRFYANWTNTSALAFLPLDPAVVLYRGRLPDVHSLDETVIGYELAQALRLSVGDTFTIQGRRFAVAGIWGPSSSLPGNFAQVSLAAAEFLAASSPLSVYAYLALPAAGEDVAEVATRIWNKVPGLAVVAPQWEMVRTAQMRTALFLAVSGSVLLFFLLCLPLLADLAAKKQPSLISLATLSGLAGLAAGCGLSFFANLYTRHTLGLTAFDVSLRLGVFAVALASGSALLMAWLGRGLTWPLRYAVTALALAVCGAAWVLVGMLNASLRGTLGEANHAAADWVALPGARADGAFLRDLARLPGIRGYAIEAYGGLANDEEERWLGPWPPSGVFYGLQLAGGEGTLSIPYRLGYCQGGPLDPNAHNEAVVGYGLAQQQALQLGDPVWIRDVPFTVVGIRNWLTYDPQSDANYRIDVSLEAFRRVLHDPFALGEATLLIPPAESQQDKTAYLDEVGARLNVARVLTVEDRLAEMVGSYPAAWTITSASAQDVVHQAKNLYGAAVVICGLLLLAAGALAVTGAMAGLLDRDVLRVGLLKAAGWDEGTLLGEYLQMASVLGAAGALPGVLGGWAAANLLNQGAESLHLIAGAASRSPQLLFTPSLGAGVFFFIVLTSMAAAVGTVSRAIRQDATQSLYSAPQESFQPGAASPVAGMVQRGGSES